VACIEFNRNGQDAVAASAEADQITMNQMRKALQDKFPAFFIDDIWVDPECGIIYAQLRRISDPDLVGM
jgi:hypothetical protein